MKIAYLIQCHKNPKQINRLIDSLSNDECEFYIHIDKKSNIDSGITKRNDIHLIDKDKRIDVKWGQNNQVRATLLMIEELIKSRKKYDYVWLISGQDFPIKSQKWINDFLEQGNDSNYIEIIDEKDERYKRYLKRNTIFYPKFIVNNKLWVKVLKKIYIMATGGNTKTIFAKRRNTTGLKFYFGSQWWNLTYECVQYINDYVKKHPSVLNFYENAVCSDECFFQTIFMNSKFRVTQKDYLTLVDWSENKRSPRTFRISDLDRLINSDFLMARKFDEKEDSEIIEAIYRNNKM